jgi:hypothetical protein
MVGKQAGNTLLGLFEIMAARLPTLQIMGHIWQYRAI